MQTKICRKISQTGMKCWDTKHSFVVPNLMLLTNLLALRTHMWTQMHEVSSLLPCLPHGSFCHGNEALIDERWGYSEWCFCPQFTVQYTCVDVRIRGQYPLYRRFFSPRHFFSRTTSGHFSNKYSTSAKVKPKNQRKRNWWDRRKDQWEHG